MGLGQTLNVPPKCHNSINNSAGKCTLLHKCPDIHMLLTNFEVYKKYFCILERSVYNYAFLIHNNTSNVLAYMLVFVVLLQWIIKWNNAIKVHFTTIKLFPIPTE